MDRGIKPTAKDVTGLIVNWMCQRVTMGAIRNFRKCQPDMPLLVIDNGSADKDFDTFATFYRARDDYERIVDTGLEKLRAGQKEFNYKLMELPYNVGRGNVLDYGVWEVKTPFILTMSCYCRILDPTLIDEYLSKIDDNVFAIGLQYHERRDYVGPFISIYRVEPIRYYHLNFGEDIFLEVGKPVFTGHGQTIHYTLTETLKIRTLKRKWRAVIYPAINHPSMVDRIAEMKVYEERPEMIERWDKYVDG